MTSDDAQVDVDHLGDDELATALLAGAVGSDWSEQAAVELLVSQRSWLRRFEFRRAVVATVIDGELCAWVVWADVDMDGPVSSGELRILEIARSLSGVASERSLGDLLSSLDETNSTRVLRAVSIACHGPATPVYGIGGRGEGVAW